MNTLTCSGASGPSVSPAPGLALRLFGGEQAPQHAGVLWTFFCLRGIWWKRAANAWRPWCAQGSLLPAPSRTQDQRKNTSLMEASPSPATGRAQSQTPCSSPKAAHPCIHLSAHPGSR